MYNDKISSFFLEKMRVFFLLKYRIIMLIKGTRYFTLTLKEVSEWITTKKASFIKA